MKSTIKHIAPWLAAAAMGAAIALAPVASADTDPTTPFGTQPTNPYIFGYHTSNDVANHTNTEVDAPF